MEDYPSNTKKERETAKAKAVLPEKNVQRITTNEVRTRKTPIGKRIRTYLIGGDTKSAWGYVVTDVLIPRAQDMLFEIISQGTERTIFGDSRGRGRPGGRSGSGYTSYNRYSKGPNGYAETKPERRELSQQARSQHRFEEILLDTPGEANKVIDQLIELVDMYQVATVEDLYSMVGIKGNYTDRNFGWTNLRDARVDRVRGGYLLNIPQPERLD